MRPCATASGVFTGVILAAALFAACSGGSTPSQPPDSAQASAPPSPAVTQGAGDTPTPAAPAAPAGPQKPKKTPQTVADCKELASDITNEPPEGVVMNNATTAADAGSSDRLQPIVEEIKQRRDGFRCCFDLYARKNPGAQGKIVWQLKLKPDGTVDSATIVQDKSDITAPEIESCMAELAGTIPWARSPSGKETTLTYPFDFKRRH